MGIVSIIIHWLVRKVYLLSHPFFHVYVNIIISCVYVLEVSWIVVIQTNIDLCAFNSLCMIL